MIRSITIVMLLWLGTTGEVTAGCHGNLFSRVRQHRAHRIAARQSCAGVQLSGRAEIPRRTAPAPACDACPPTASASAPTKVSVLLPLQRLNIRRARLGLYALVEDPGLTVVAVTKSRHRARCRIMGHDGSAMWGARGEGVGCGSGEFHTCYWSTRSHRFAGAATAYDASGRSYHTLLVR